MNTIQMKSLAFIDALLDGMDDDAFLREYHSVERHIGISVDVFLHKPNKYNQFLSSAVSFPQSEKGIDWSSQYQSKKAYYPHSTNDVVYYAANDSTYLQQLAA